MPKRKKLTLQCPHCGGTKFHLEDPNLHLRNLKGVYRAADGSLTAEWGRERVETDLRLILWCSGCPNSFSVTGWDENEIIEEFLEEIEAAALTP